MSQQVAVLDCSAGVSGEMLLSAFVHVGFSLQHLHAVLSSLSIHEESVRTLARKEHDVQGLSLEIAIKVDAAEVYRYEEIIHIIERLPISTHARQSTMTVMQCWWFTDQSRHKTAVLEALVLIVGVVLAREKLHIVKIYTPFIPVAMGTQDSASIEIIQRTGVPAKMVVGEHIQTTSLGVALLASLASFTTPTFRLQKTAYGFNQPSSSQSRSIQLYLGSLQNAENSVTSNRRSETDQVAVLETHIDNMSGELVGALMERLLAEGALDVSFAPLQMKKNRPASLVTVICRIQDDETFAHILLRETSTLGVRIQHTRRLKAQREQIQLETPLGALLVKVKRLDGEIISASPEYEECQRLATLHQIPLIDVYEVARNSINDAIVLKRNQDKQNNRKEV